MEPQTDYLSDIPETENFGYSLASRWTRLFATIIESLIIYVPLSFIAGYMPSFFEAPDDGMDLSWGAFNLLPNFFQTGCAALMGVVCYPVWSGNLGHKLFGLKVISAVDGTDQDTAAAGAIREVLKNVLGVFIIPSIWLLWDHKKQNLYDKITKTLVVDKK